MTLKLLLGGVAVAACLAASGAHAQFVTNLGNEDAANGLVADLFPSFGYMVASDGEAAFDPFGFGSDTSDGLNFNQVNHVWTQAADSNWTFLGGQTWVLPASIPGCGSENSTTCEPTGHFVSPDAWSPGAIGTFLIFDPNGTTLSDRIVTFNTANGAELLFFSDPSLGVPEPATWAIMLTGFFGLGAMIRRRKEALA